jgi:hypothetical protein
MSPQLHYSARKRICKFGRDWIVRDEGQTVFSLLDALEKQNLHCVARKFNFRVRKFAETYLAERAHHFMARHRDGSRSSRYNELAEDRKLNRAEMEDCIAVLTSGSASEHDRLRAKWRFKQADYCFHLTIVSLANDPELRKIWIKLAKRRDALFHPWELLTPSRMRKIIRQHEDYANRIMWPAGGSEIRGVVNHHLEFALSVFPRREWCNGCSESSRVGQLLGTRD